MDAKKGAVCQAKQLLQTSFKRTNKWVFVEVEEFVCVFVCMSRLNSTRFRGDLRPVKFVSLVSQLVPFW